MIVCDICGTRVDGSKWTERYEVEAKIVGHGLRAVSDEFERLTAKRDFCPKCWTKIVDFIEECKHERGNQM